MTISTVIQLAAIAGKSRSQIMREGKQVQKQQLEEKHPEYKKNKTEWELYELAYEGGMPFITYCLHRYSSKETTKNWAERIRDGYVFNYAQTVVDLFNFYLTETDTKRELGGLTEDPQWQMFSLDADLIKTNFVEWIEDAQKSSSVGGSLGILVNKPPSSAKNVQDEINQEIYPYVAAYSLINIYDWEFQRNKESHRPVLTYLKLREEDGSYLLWWVEKWERWGLHRQTGVPTKLDSGDNPLGEIPFTWMPNVKRTKHAHLGVSDLVDISRIVASIVRNTSCGEEIIKLSGFPILRLPDEDTSPEESDDDEAEVEVGGRAVLGFNPEYTDGRPDWMPSEVKDPIEAILMWIDRKIDEILRISHLSGVHGQRTSGQAQAGIALRYSFRQLFSVLNKKSDNMSEAEMQIIRLWLKWAGKEELFKEISIERSKEFSIDDLAVALDNMFTSMRNMVSKEFRVKAQMKVVGMVLPETDEKTVKTIEEETIKHTPDTIPIFEEDTLDNETGGGKTVRPADQANLNQK